MLDSIQTYVLFDNNFYMWLSRNKRTYTGFLFYLICWFLFFTGMIADRFFSMEFNLNLDWYDQWWLCEYHIDHIIIIKTMIYIRKNNGRQINDYSKHCCNQSLNMCILCIHTSIGNNVIDVSEKKISSCEICLCLYM